MRDLLLGMNQIVQTTVKVNNDYSVVKIFDEIGNEWAKEITSFNCECNHCDFIQVSNRGGWYGNIGYHLEKVHNKTIED